MRYVVLGARIIEGLIFLIFGLNTLLHFFNTPLPSGDALTWFGLMAGHHWINFVAVLELIGGILLLVGRFVPLALTLLAPVIVNILLYHALLWPHGYALAIVVMMMEAFLLGVYWRSFAPLLRPDPETRTPQL
ncbi:MAG TPA: DoxX family membrane protein [Candidatus Aquilonibacter sp.]|nr:DoxX family membrane protein [Candidatus Aquilonibacter sp.]